MLGLALREADADTVADAVCEECFGRRERVAGSAVTEGGRAGVRPRTAA
jgi:hypothetical protein